ncbi:MAG: hypothetical protein AAGK14_10675 [Verrucomicrobiota bacterium]
MSWLLAGAVVLAPGTVPAADEAEMAPVARPEAMQPKPTFTDQDQPKVRPQLIDPGVAAPAGFRQMSERDFALHLLEQEMKYNPEIRQKVERFFAKEREKAAKEKLEDMKEARQESILENNWMLKNLREVYLSQGEPIPEDLKTPEEMTQQDSDRNAMQNAWDEAKTPEEFMKMWQDSVDRISGRSNPKTGTALEVKELTSAELLRLPLAERIRYNRERYKEMRQEEEDESLEPAENPEGGNEMLTLRAADEDGFDQRVAVIENDPAKATFGPGELQWFETEGDTLPIAGPDTAEGAAMRHGLIPGEFELYWDKIKAANDELLADQNADPADLTLHRENFNRPNLDIPMEQFIEQATVGAEEVRRAERIEERRAEIKEQRTRMLRPRMEMTNPFAIQSPMMMLDVNGRRMVEEKMRRAQKGNR